MCDVDIRTIQRIEKGQQNISLTLLLSLIAALGIHVDDLLGDLSDRITKTNLEA